MSPETDREVLVLALVLALTAPTDKKARKALEIAEDLARSLSAKDIKQAKKEAQKLLKEIEA